ncbi:DNA (cytosine-5-)-methyltransferase, partial [Mycoplasmopsis bovis]|uniref:DNA (cytosine-5-)-methyltransferase n=1 Tax=Mycoplasmopsis bovis TaxID=28903 RepID=UPI003D2749E6
FVSNVDIRKVNVNDIPDVDIILSGFPCTSFSIAGYRKGFEDEKSGDLFFETLRVIVSKQPKAFLLENVKNLVGHDDGKTFKSIHSPLMTAW